MNTTTTKSDTHPFELAGYGPGPYIEQGQLEDTDCGLVCDACGKTHLRYQFELLSSTNQLFGVGSECIKKAAEMGVPGLVEITPRSDDFVFRVETTGALPPATVVVWALETIEEKLKGTQEDIKKLIM